MLLLEARLYQCEEETLFIGSVARWVKIEANDLYTETGKRVINCLYSHIVKEKKREAHKHALVFISLNWRKRRAIANIKEGQKEPEFRFSLCMDGNHFPSGTLPPPPVKCYHLTLESLFKLADNQSYIKLINHYMKECDSKENAPLLERESLLFIRVYQDAPQKPLYCYSCIAALETDIDKYMMKFLPPKMILVKVRILSETTYISLPSSKWCKRIGFTDGDMLQAKFSNNRYS